MSYTHNNRLSSSSESYRGISGASGILGASSEPKPKTIRENFTACLAGGNTMYYQDDGYSSQRALDCPISPSWVSSVYPGQACNNGIYFNNLAVQKGVTTSSQDFPVRSCGTNNYDTFSCSQLGLRYMPNDSLTGCFPIVHQSTLYYPTMESCVQNTVNVSYPSAPSVPSDKLNQAMYATKNAFGTGTAGNIPFCGNYSGTITNNRPQISGLYGCISGSTGNYKYKTLPDAADISCSKSLLNSVPPKGALGSS